MSAAQSSKPWRLAPGSDELATVLNGLGAQGEARDVLAFVSGRDPKTFALAVGFAAPHLLPERLRVMALDHLNGGKA